MRMQCPEAGSIELTQVNPNEPKPPFTVTRALQVLPGVLIRLLEIRPAQKVRTTW